ncbi:hypothetical protein AB1484_31485 [Parafrankia sp. FMc6]|uniref:hypothetical protein n=1 Tax=Parafrankia soli TaxID=2599596 RepID=UPI0034D7B96E
MVIGILTGQIAPTYDAIRSFTMGCRPFALSNRGIVGLSSRLGAMVVAVIMFAGCSSDSGGSASPESTSLTSSPSPVVGTSRPPSPSPSPAPVPTPLPTSAYPPLAGFGEVHDIGKVVGISDGPDGTVLSLDRSKYVLCTPQSGDAETCLDGYRIDDVEGGTLDYVVTPTVRVVLPVRPEEYETGDLADLREFVAARPSSLMILRLDAGGRVMAVGQPWLP